MTVTWRLLRLARSNTLLPVLAVTLVALGASGCAPGPAASSGTSGTGPLVVVTTTSVFADMVANVGGDLVRVTSLVPKNGDVHTYEPRPADVASVASARLLVMNGLGLDDWLTKLLTAASAAGTPLLKLGVDLPGVSLLPGETAATENPHLWMDVKYAEGYVDRIGAALSAADPAAAATFAANATVYKARLDALDASVRAKIASIPPANRSPVIRVLVDRSYLESRTVPGADGTPLHATVSAGCAVIDPADPTRESLIGRADVALFMAKEAGRNQVVAAAQDVARSLQQGRTAT
jgi:ABC-type Zn uptake system ZnuABC Zn-binding protein ZnuA